MRSFFCFFLLCSCLHAGELISKAKVLEKINTSISNKDLLISFRDSSLIGKVSRTFPTSNETNKNPQISNLLRKNIEFLAIKKFSLEELNEIDKMLCGSIVQKKLSTTLLVLMILSEPHVTMEISQVITKNLKEYTNRLGTEYEFEIDEREEHISKRDALIKKQRKEVEKLEKERDAQLKNNVSP